MKQIPKSYASSEIFWQVRTRFHVLEVTSTTNEEIATGNIADYIVLLPDKIRNSNVDVIIKSIINAVKKYFSNWIVTYNACFFKMLIIHWTFLILEQIKLILLGIKCYFHLCIIRTETMLHIVNEIISYSCICISLLIILHWSLWLFTVSSYYHRIVLNE